jgi:hypothetical protein
MGIEAITTQEPPTRDYLFGTWYVQYRSIWDDSLQRAETEVNASVAVLVCHGMGHGRLHSHGILVYIIMQGRPAPAPIAARWLRSCKIEEG